MRVAIGFSCLLMATVALGACSDPVPPAARGSLTLSLAKPTKEGLLCPPFAARHLVPDGQTQSQATASSSGDLVTDGQDNSEIRCKVQGSGPYTFSGSIKYKSREFQIVDGTVPGKGATGEGLISIYTIDTQTLGKNTCEIGAIEVAPGKIWGSFKCAALQGSETSTACTANGWFAFDHCDK